MVISKMLDKIFGIIAIIIVVVGCIWGWWYENGPEKKDK